MSMQTNCEAVREFYRCVASADADGLERVIKDRFDQDAAMILPESLPYGGTLTGSAKLARALSKAAKSTMPMGVQNVSVVDIIDGGEHIAAQLEFDWYSPDTTDFIKTGAVELWTFRRGYVREIRAYYWDTAACAALSTKASGA